MSVDPVTYADLERLRRRLGMRSVCEVMLSFARILIDRTKEASHRAFDLAPDEGEYIDGMFDELGTTYRRTPELIERRRKHG